MNNGPSHEGRGVVTVGAMVVGCGCAHGCVRGFGTSGLRLAADGLVTNLEQEKEKAGKERARYELDKEKMKAF